MAGRFVGDRLADVLWSRDSDDEALVGASSSSRSTHGSVPVNHGVWACIGLGDEGSQASQAPPPAVPANAANVADGVDNDDDDDDDVIVVIDPIRPPNDSVRYAADPVAYWVQKLGDAMATAVSDVESFGGDVRWCLPPALGTNIVNWTIAHINNECSSGLVNTYYVGITHLVGNRWRGTPKMVGHRSKGWHRMHLVGLSDQDWVIAKAEEEVLKKFRYYGPSGRPLYPLINGCRVGGSMNCENKNKGGEGGLGGDPPHIIYVCFRWQKTRPFRFATSEA